MQHVVASLYSLLPTSYDVGGGCAGPPRAPPEQWRRLPPPLVPWRCLRIVQSKGPGLRCSLRKALLSCGAASPPPVLLSPGALVCAACSGCSAPRRPFSADHTSWPSCPSSLDSTPAELAFVSASGSHGPGLDWMGRWDPGGLGDQAAGGVGVKAGPTPLELS